MRKSLLLIPAAAAIAAATLAVRRPKVNLRGQVVLITGGSRGLGLAMARAFAREGCRLMLCARDAAELDRAAAGLSAAGAGVHTFVCNVADRFAVSRLIQATIERYGRLDLVVNDAGIIQVGPLTAMTVEDFKRPWTSCLGHGVRRSPRCRTLRPGAAS